MRKIADEVLLIPITQNGADLQKVFSLNRTAAYVWELLEEPQTMHDINIKVCQNFHSDTVSIREELLDLMNYFIEKNWVETT